MERRVRLVFWRHIPPNIGGSSLMETPRYLQVLWAHKVLLVISLVLAAAVGVVAGYRVTGSGLEPRATTTYSAATTVLVSVPQSNLFSGTTESPVDPTATSVAQPVSPSQLAVVYAYLVTGDIVRRDVQRALGGLRSGESVTAVRRTTQPGGSERFPGREQLPILDVIGIADSAKRAEEIANAARKSFFAYVAQQQDDDNIAASKRVRLEEIAGARAVEEEGGSAVLPVVIGFVGSLLVFLGLILVVDAVTGSRGRRGGGGRRRDEVDDFDFADDWRRSDQTPTVA